MSFHLFGKKGRRACERGDWDRPFGGVGFVMATDIEPASSNTVWHSICVPLMEPGGRVEGECKYLGEFSSPWNK